MEKFWIFLGTSVLLTHPAKAQDTLMLYQAYTSFSDPEKAEWTAFQNNWNYFDYAALKQKHGIKSMNCKSCESFYADLYVEIDAIGKVTLAQCKRASRCGMITNDTILFSDFEATIRKQQYSALKNKRFVVRLGYVLKC
jgi:hypothetical protein